MQRVVLPGKRYKIIELTEYAEHFCVTVSYLRTFLHILLLVQILFSSIPYLANCFSEFRLEFTSVGMLSLTTLHPNLEKKLPSKFSNNTVY